MIVRLTSAYTQASKAAESVAENRLQQSRQMIGSGRDVDEAISDASRSIDDLKILQTFIADEMENACEGLRKSWDLSDLFDGMFSAAPARRVIDEGEERIVIVHVGDWSASFWFGTVEAQKCALGLRFTHAEDQKIEVLREDVAAYLESVSGEENGEGE